MDQHDEESDPRRPEGDGGDVSGIEEGPRPSLCGRRRKAIAAVAAIVFAGAVAVGVALLRPGPQSPTEHDGAVRGSSANAVDEFDAVGESADAREQSTDAEGVDEEADEDMFQAYTPWEENSAISSDADVAEDTSDVGDAGDAGDLDPSYDDADNEELDIIMDVGYEHAYPGDLIADGDIFQREPEEDLPPAVVNAAKVEYNSEDFKLETAFFEGPITDFIVTPDVSRIASKSSTACPQANEGLWRMTLETDNYPWETYWQLMDLNNEVLAFGPPKQRNYARSTKYIGQMCFKAGRYKLVLGDKNDDGFCCKYGRGSMVMEVNGKTVAMQRGNEIFDEKVFTFRIQGVGNGNPPTPPPTPSPTTQPTTPPTQLTNSPVQPTTSPTLRPTVPELNQTGCKTVEIKVVNDRFASETSYTFTPVDDPNTVILERAPGTMEGSATYRDTTCVQDGNYRMTVTDPFQGIQEKGYYSVSVEGEEVMYGSVFTGGEQEHIIRVGYEPPMTKQEREWLDAHNSRREAYYADAGLPSKDLVWSPQLAEEASNWAEEILPTCKLVREQGLRAGENMSARTSGREKDEGPEIILRRWVDKKVKAEYPENQSLTQVFWRASRFVGCTAKSRQRADGSWCYVTICRYGRAGNCAIGQYPDWETAVTTDRTPCGPICPENGNECY